jgi:hypothetical protein
MEHFKVNPKDIFFILKDQLQYGQFCHLDRYQNLNENTFDLLVNGAIRFARGVMDPLNAIETCLRPGREILDISDNAF